MSDAQATGAPQTKVTIAVVSAGLGQPSSTRQLAGRMADATASALATRGRGAEVHHVELRDLAHDIADNLATGFPGERLHQAIEAVTGADALIAVTPIFSASYSGLFKSFFDVLDTAVLAGKPVLLGATGGTARHSLALDHALRPLFAYLRALVLPTAVFAAPQDWGGAGDALTDSLPGRIARAGEELAAALSGPVPPSPRTDPFAHVVPFAEQLAAVGLG
jgi:FMN reductase